MKRMIFVNNVNLTRLCREYLTAYANISKLKYSSCKNGPSCKNPNCSCKNPNCPSKPKPVKPSVQCPLWGPPSPPSPCDSPLTNSYASAASKASTSCCGDCPPLKPCNSPPPSPKCCDPYSHILPDLPLIPFSPYDFPPCPCDYLPHAFCDSQPSPCDSPSTFESFYGSLKSDSQKLSSLEPLETSAASSCASSDTEQPKCSLKEAPKEEPNASTCPLADLYKGKCVCIPDFRGGYEISSPEYFHASQPQPERDRECTPTFPGDAKIPPSTPQPKELPESFSMGAATEFCRVAFKKCLDFCIRSLNRK